MKKEIDYKNTLTNEQFIALSWLAYYVRLEHSNKDYHRGAENAIYGVCESLNIPFKYLWNVQHEKHAKGLINYNKTAYIEYWNY